jgi:steroid delta-isomerase-like uncharacterized protein
MPDEEHYAKLLRRHMDVENAHRLDETLATLTEDCRFDDRALGRVYEGHKGAAEFYAMWWDAFDVQVSAEELHFTSPKSAVARTWWRGLHVKTFLGLPATYRELELPVAVFVTLRDGLIAGEQLYWDRMTLFEQLGGVGVTGR